MLPVEMVPWRTACWSPPDPMCTLARSNNCVRHPLGCDQLVQLHPAVVTEMRDFLVGDQFLMSLASSVSFVSYRPSSLPHAENAPVNDDAQSRHRHHAPPARITPTSALRRAWPRVRASPPRIFLVRHRTVTRIEVAGADALAESGATMTDRASRSVEYVSLNFAVATVDPPAPRPVLYSFEIGEDRNTGRAVHLLR